MEKFFDLVSTVSPMGLDGFCCGKAQAGGPRISLDTILVDFFFGDQGFGEFFEQIPLPESINSAAASAS